LSRQGSPRGIDGTSLRGQRVAVLGFGSQGEAQARNLRDAGVDVVVGAREGRPSAKRAADLGFQVSAPADAARGANVCAILLPDEVVPGLWPVLAVAFAPSVGLVFAHGFNLVYSELTFPPQADVVLVSPTGPGPAFREVVERGERLPAYIAVHRDASGRASEMARAYAAAIGCGPLLETTVREETEVDLFGEQTVLCGGLHALTRAAFDILVARGYSPEMAYLECVHQIKYLADLLHARGPSGFRKAISGTALFGDLTRGPRVIGPASRAAMETILDEIRSGSFAREWIQEVAAGRARLDELSAREAAHPIEEARRRALAPEGGPAGDRGKPRNALSKN
jgi:ketol-acid reductoisomerase